MPIDCHVVRIGSMRQGGLVPGHVLIIPVSHQQRYSDMSPEGARETERYKESFSK